MSFDLPRRHFLHVLKTHYPDGSTANHNALFNYHFGTDFNDRKIGGEYSGRSGGIGDTKSRNMMWETDICRDEYNLGGTTPFNARQQSDRWQALQDIQLAITALQLQNEDGMGQVALLSGMEHADPTARAVRSTIPTPTSTGVLNVSPGSISPGSDGSAAVNSSSAPQATSVVAGQNASSNVSLQLSGLHSHSGRLSITALSPIVTSSAAATCLLMLPADVPPLPMVHYSHIQWSYAPGVAAGSSQEFGTIWTDESDFIDSASPIYQLGGPVHLINFDAAPNDNRAAMVCRRDHCSYCYPRPSVLLQVLLPGETSGLPFVHTEDLYPLGGGLFEFRVRRYSRYTPDVTNTNFGRMVRFSDGVIRRVRVCDISCAGCKLGD